MAGRTWLRGIAGTEKLIITSSIEELIPSLVDQDRYAQSRDPIEMIVQG
jgi:hypothetical protein